MNVYIGEDVFSYVLSLPLKCLPDQEVNRVNLFVRKN